MKCQWFGALSRKVHPFKTESSVIWTHGAEGSGQFRSLLIQPKATVTANHLNFPHFDNSAFCNIFAKSNRFFCIFAESACPNGGIGRRVGLKIQCP